MISNNFERIFEPDSVAVIGASPKPDSMGNDIWSIFDNFGFVGDIYPVNPNYEKINDKRTYSSVKDIEGEVDLAIVVIPANKVPEVAQNCIEKGVKGIIVVSGGFSEVGHEELENELLKTIERSSTKLIGPNCMGIYCPSGKISFDSLFPKESGNVSFITQSGGIGKIFTFLFAERGGRISKLVSSGNEIDLRFIDYINYFSGDRETEVIAGYVEQFRGGENFLSEARAITREKPIILWKVGRGEAGKRATMSHTGALAGSAKVYSGVLNQMGILEARSLEELVDYTLTFSCLEPREIENVGVVTGPGGVGVSIVDACEEEGLNVPSLSEKLKQELQQEFPSYIQISNPIDLTFAIEKKPDLIQKPLEKMMEEERIDMTVIGGTPRAGIIQKSSEILKMISKEYKKPLAIVSPKFREAGEKIRELVKAGVPIYSTANGFSKSVKALDWYARYR